MRLGCQYGVTNSNFGVEMSVGAIGESQATTADLPEENGSGLWDFLSSIFSFLTTQYHMGYQSGLYVYKSGGHLINEGTIEGTYTLSLDYNTVTNRGALSSCRGDLTIRADKIAFQPGSTVEGNTIHLDARIIEIDGADVLSKEALKVTSCQEIFLRGISLESPTWHVLDHLPPRLYQNHNY